MTRDEIIRWYNTCRACGRIQPYQDMYAYFAGNYCSAACYSTLFANCLFCGKYCMAAQGHLHQHGKRLCDTCFDKHLGVVLSAEQVQERTIKQLMRACWKLEYTDQATCTCACHTYQGTYPTSKARPCWVCGHYEEHP